MTSEQSLLLDYERLLNAAEDVVQAWRDSDDRDFALMERAIVNLERRLPSAE